MLRIRLIHGRVLQLVLLHRGGAFLRADLDADRARRVQGGVHGVLKRSLGCARRRGETRGESDAGHQR
jgi:hypothetical protein